MQTIRPKLPSLRTKVDDVAFALCLSAFATTLVTFAGTAAAAEPPASNRPAAAASGRPAVGTFTGTYVNGAPVYRLPSVSVSASRSAELAATKRENERASAAAASASAGLQPDPAIRGVRPPV